MRIEPAEYLGLPLRAHALLAGVPLHDVWRLDLAGGGPGRTVRDLRELLLREPLSQANPAVRGLFGLRRALGRLFGWDEEESPGRVSAESFVHTLSDADRAASLVEPGTPDGPFHTLFADERESIAEVRNATVHAFLVYALHERAGGYRLHWAVYVRPVSAFTGVYMAVIDPFRRWIVYPAVLRHIERAWRREFAGAA